MRLDLPTVGSQVSPTLDLVVGVVGVEECLQRDLGVDGDVLRPRQVDHHVRSEPSGVTIRGHLLVEVAVLDHAGHLHDAA